MVLMMLFLLPQSSQAQAIPMTELNGYAWSETVGWMSLNCKTGGPTGNDICASRNYRVTINSNRLLDGYAWSEHIGWVKFGGLNVSNAPSGSGTSKVNAQVTGTYPNLTFTGWARACAATLGGNCTSATTDPNAGGWDGWISLGGTNYSVRTSDSGMVANSYAWGSQVVGWIDMFSRVTLLTPTATLSGTNCTISEGASTCSSSLTWSFTNTSEPSLYNVARNTEYSTANSGTNKGFAVQHGDNLIEARDGSVVLAKVLINASCESGTIYNGSVCEPEPALPPTITISAEAPLVRYAEPVVLSWEIIGLEDGSCLVTGPGVNRSVTSSGSWTSGALTGVSEFTLTCTGSFGSVTESTTIEVVPRSEER